ncbi:unnamed protein product, partial [Mesorhabditis belari]|uniref:Uncharacterized protein n=1 Tax=Mesorhabditis belari TaxID=2138241 RepID=A0AAF3FMQ5_9BILA
MIFILVFLFSLNYAEEDPKINDSRKALVEVRWNGFKVSNETFVKLWIGSNGAGERVKFLDTSAIQLKRENTAAIWEGTIKLKPMDRYVHFEAVRKLAEIRVSRPALIHLSPQFFRGLKIEEIGPTFSIKLKLLEVE